MRTSLSWHGRAPRLGALVLCAAAGFAAGCGDNDPMGNPNGDMGNPNVVPAEPAAGKSLGGAGTPSVAALDKDGKTAYVLVTDADQNIQLMSYPTNGTEPAKIATSVPLQAPTAIAIDGTDTLYIADIGHDNGGVVYRGSLSGALSVVTSDIRAPAGIAISPDGKDLFVTGQDKDGAPAVFQVPAAGGTATVASKGAPLSQPSGLTFSADGTLYVMDGTVNGPREGAVLKVMGSTATVFSKGSMTVAFPAGLAQSGATGLLATSNATGAAAIYAIASDGTVKEQVLSGDKLSLDGDPTTIARAAKANAWVVVDTATPPQKTAGVLGGSVLFLTP